MEKNYTVPKFELVRQDEQNRVFFTASGGGPTEVTATGSITSMSKTSASW